MQELPPLQYTDLDVVVQESRATKQAAQDAERAVAQEQPLSEPAAGDDQALSSVLSLEGPLLDSGTTRVEGEPARDESAQASVGGAVWLSPGGDSETGQDVGVEPLEEKAPPVMKAERKDLAADDSVLELESKKIVRRTVVRVKSDSTSVPGAAELGSAAQATSGPVVPAFSQADALAKAYVAHQVHRWEQVLSGRGFPPQVAYTWSEVPDYAYKLDWMIGTKHGSLSYGQNAVVSDANPPCSKLASVPLCFRLCSSKQFNNVVPEWFRTNDVNVGLDQNRFVTDTIQCLFTEEFIE
ncbi:LOW QUALITY PROTEIN: hypothetical protein PHMEG_0009795 [Phytophthora megakarya]|uniref:Uncharacterized protein n=1 Tax=Phytophthora megakarya TaxID=4795 RepID=A0A225WG80_9STRA|nr:LOW QUALITY PROTEIN: hypothetical protein PHMEG_0009795 [Phytophthora megakarya]